MKAITLFRYKVQILFLVAVVVAAIVTPVIFWAIAALGLAGVVGAIAVGLVVDLMLILAVTFGVYKGLKKALLNEAKAFFKKAYDYYKEKCGNYEIDAKYFEDCLKYLTVSEKKGDLIFVSKDSRGKYFLTDSLNLLFNFVADNNRQVIEKSVSLASLEDSSGSEIKQGIPESESSSDDCDTKIFLSKEKWENYLFNLDAFLSQDSQKQKTVSMSVKPMSDMKRYGKGSNKDGCYESEDSYSLEDSIMEDGDKTKLLDFFIRMCDYSLQEANSEVGYSNRKVNLDQVKGCFAESKDFKCESKGENYIFSFCGKGAPSKLLNFEKAFFDFCSSVLKLPEKEIKEKVFFMYSAPLYGVMIDKTFLDSLEDKLDKLEKTNNDDEFSY